MILLVLIAVFPAVGREETYTFDPSEIEKKPYHFGGYIEARPVFYWADTNAALYKLKFYNQDVGRTLQEYNFKLQLEGSYEKDIARLYFKTNTDYKNSYLGEDEKSTFYEAYGTLRAVSILLKSTRARGISSGGRVMPGIPLHSLTGRRIRKTPRSR